MMSSSFVLPIVPIHHQSFHDSSCRKKRSVRFFLRFEIAIAGLPVEIQNEKEKIQKFPFLLLRFQRYLSFFFLNINFSKNIFTGPRLVSFKFFLQFESFSSSFRTEKKKKKNIHLFGVPFTFQRCVKEIILLFHVSKKYIIRNSVPCWFSCFSSFCFF